MCQIIKTESELMKSNYYLKISTQLTTAFLVLIATGCSEKHHFTAVHTNFENEATIAIKGLKETTKVLHISDSHISVVDDNEKEFHIYSTRMDNAYKSVPHYKTKESTTPDQTFSELMDLAESQNVDVIALTGDIINNPSKSSVTFVAESLGKTGIPFIYTAGNHDWHYEGMEGSAATLRETWIQNSLLPLYNGSNPLYSSHVIGGINFVALDNSNYQINEEQLNFFQEQADRPMPIVLLMHIPLYLPKNAERNHINTCGDPRWGWDMDDNYEIERRERWSRHGNLPSTVQFLEAAKKCASLIAILAGHTHRPSADQFSETAVQYVTGRSADGQHRLIVFKPLPKF